MARAGPGSEGCRLSVFSSCTVGCHGSLVSISTPRMMMLGPASRSENRRLTTDDRAVAFAAEQSRNAATVLIRERCPPTGSTTTGNHLSWVLEAPIDERGGIAPPDATPARTSMSQPRVAVQKWRAVGPQKVGSAFLYGAHRYSAGPRT